MKNSNDTDSFKAATGFEDTTDQMPYSRDNNNAFNIGYYALDFMTRLLK
jgi:hypothetical protein